MYPHLLRSAWELDAHLANVSDSELPCYDAIIPVLLKEGIDALSAECKLTPGTFSLQTKAD